MSQFNLTRRDFFIGCSTAIAAMASGRLGYVAFGNPASEPNQEILVVVFLRGGIDGLNLVPPIDGADRGFYQSARPTLAIPASGSNAALPLGALGATQFGLHPLATPLHEVFQEQRLAIIHAAGLKHETRSHFDAMEFMELGTPGSKTIGRGWLARHMESATNLPDTIIAPAMTAGTSNPTALRGDGESFAIQDPGGFSFGGNWRYSDSQRTTLRRMYDGDSFVHQAGFQTLDAIDILESRLPRDDEGRYSYQAANGAQYPDSSFSRNMQTIAQVVKMQIGLRVATIDLGGWDTHENQGPGGDAATYFPFNGRIDDLSRTLNAFYTDMSGAGTENYMQRTTVVVMSEFGRRLKENGNRGTDHGHGNVMIVMGGNVNGGMHGNWPGLNRDEDQLFQNEDLAITTDYRQVLSEILIRRMGNPNIPFIFPDYTGYAPLGVVAGEDIGLPPAIDPANNIYLPRVPAKRIYVPNSYPEPTR
ncbi:MAG: DUF1501 domain-containing protein [Chloroflexaceae bacterium]|nr:DUF1501 domain-containing protein [Chloroflexaceae bacterium]NJO05585.1 DUF1501 domain-containing protein [Chloroflexaceae bacterium]